MLNRPQEKPTTTEQRRKKRESSFLHDATAFNDPKIIRLRQKYGFEGYGVFWAVVEKLRLCQGYQFNYSDLDVLSFELHIEFEKLREILDFCIEIGLFVLSDDVFYSKSLDERMEEFNGVSRKNSESGKKGGLISAAKRKENRESVAIATHMPKASDGQATLEPLSSGYNTIQSNTKESNTSEPPKAPDPPNLHPSLDAPKHLKRKKDKLIECGTSSGVWLTDSERHYLVDRWGENELSFLITELASYATTNAAKFRKYIDHFKVLVKWRKQKHERGLGFYQHPKTGWGFYKHYEIERYEMTA